MSQGTMIEVQSEQPERESFAAYYCAPTGESNGKAVIVLQEYWGLVPHIKALADRFAAAGFAALAPDLFHGDSTESPDEAGRLLMALDIERAAHDLGAAARELKTRAGIKGGVGVVGFCMGGQLALLAATSAPEDVGAAVNFYGIHPKVEPDFSRLSAPVLGLFAENDEFVPAENVEKLVAAIGAAGKSIEHHVYPGVGHAFFNDTRPDAYDAAAATDAWERTLNFLSSHLS